MRALADAGHDVTLVTTHSGNRDIGVPLIEMRRPGPLERRLPEALRVRIVAARLRGVFRRGHFDLLNVQQMTSVGILAASVFDGPTMLNFWGSDLLLPDLTPAWARALLPKVVRSAQAVQVCSRQMRDAAVALGGEPERLVCFQYGVDLDMFRFGGAPRTGHTIVSTRLLKPLYRIDVLIRAFALVRERFPDATLKLFGGGESRDDLVKLADDLGVGDAVEFLGHVTPERIAAAVAEAAVWVSLPPSDASALSMQEAMAAGAVPVVADIPTPHDWVREGCGVFVSDVTPEGVAAGIAEGVRLAESADYAGPNRAVVEAQGDRTKNLPRFARVAEAAADRRAADPADR